MQISGNGITPFTVKVRNGYKPLTGLAIKWRKLASGNWSGLDRGTGADVYEAMVNFREKEATINTFIDEIEANRIHATPNAVTLDTFFDDERIFGENVDHTGSVAATVMNTGQRQQLSWKYWGVDVRLRATFDPSDGGNFTGSSSLPTLEYCEPSIKGDSSYTINKFDTYDGTMSYLDHRADAGIFEGIFTLTRANMLLIRNYIKTQRTGDFTLADNFGVDYPFGTRSANSYSFTTKLIEWEDLGLWGLLHNKIRLVFAEVA